MEKTLSFGEKRQGSSSSNMQKLNQAPARCTLEKRISVNIGPKDERPISPISVKDPAIHALKRETQSDTGERHRLDRLCFDSSVVSWRIGALL